MLKFKKHLLTPIFLILLLILLLNIPIYSQNTDLPQNLPVELYPMAKSTSNPQDSTLFTMEAVSTVWGGHADGYYSTLKTYFSNDYNYLTYSVKNDNNVHSGWDFVLSNSLGHIPFGYGKYKLSVFLGILEKYIYLDYRDDHCGFYHTFGTPTGQQIDVWIKFNHDDNKFYINSYDGEASDPHWVSVSKGTTIKIWKLKGFESPSTGKFEPYTPVNLTITSNSNDKPILTWQHHIPNDDYWIGYQIYRLVTNKYKNTGNFIKIAEVDKDTLTYIDNSLILNNNEIAYYKIKTKNVDAFSEYSNLAKFPKIPPNSPQNFQVNKYTSIYPNRPLITWGKNTELNLSGYKIERKIDNGSWSTIYTASVDDTSYIDMFILIWTKNNFQTVYYRMRAFDINNLYSSYTPTKSIDFHIMLKQVKKENKTNNSITDFNLSQNYPNPFNPTTTIKYDIPKSTYVTLKVYNIAGQLVATLVNEQKTAGRYSVTWNAENISSGIYFYRITAGNFSDVKKCIILK